MIFLLLFASFCFARYFITDPLSNTTWTTGYPANVFWKVTNGGQPQAKYLTVDLMTGLDSNSQWVTTLCDNLPPSATSCSVPTLPTFIGTMTYSVRIAYNNDNHDYDYSPKFKINGNFASSIDNLSRQPPPVSCIGDCNQVINENPGQTTNDLNKNINTGFDPRQLVGSSLSLRPVYELCAITLFGIFLPFLLI